MLNEFEPDVPFRAAGAAYMLSQCRKIAKHLPGARRGDDPEDLHDVRVGLRRLRTAMVVFRACFPARQYQVWYERLTQLARALAHVRDMDVQIEMIRGVREALPPEHQAGIEAWLLEHEGRRGEARVEMVAVLDRWEADGMSDGLCEVIQIMGYPMEDMSARTLEMEKTFVARLTEDHAAPGGGSDV